MANESRWFRRNVDMMDSVWLASLPWASRAVWDEILAYVKTTGSGGKCRAPLIQRFAAFRDIPVENVSECLAAAIADGALIDEDGSWIIANWTAYQGEDRTNNDRQRRHRENKRANTPLPEDVTESNGTVTPLHCHATETGTETGTLTKTGTGRGVGETKLRTILMEVPAFAKSPPAAGELDEILEDFAELGDAAIIRHAKAARDWALAPKTRYARSPDKPADGVKFLRNWLEKEIRSGRNGAASDSPPEAVKGWNPTEEELAEIHR